MKKSKNNLIFSTEETEFYCDSISLNSTVLIRNTKNRKEIEIYGNDIFDFIRDWIVKEKVKELTKSTTPRSEFLKKFNL